MLKTILSFLVFLVVSIQIGYSSDTYNTPRRIEGAFTFEMIIDPANPDDVNNLKYWLLLPTNSESQKNIEFTSIDPEPDNLVGNKNEDRQIGYWEISPQQNSKSLTVRIELKADLYKIDFFLDPDIVPDDYRRHQDIVAQYSTSDSLAFITPEMIELVSEITRSVTDPFLKARNIYRWILLHLEPQFPIIQRGTRYLFAHPINSQQNIYEGDSAEYSWVFIALCRAAGVPARSVTGFLVKPGSELPHTWAEFFLPKWGWLPADPYLGDSRELLLEFSNQSDDSYYLGHLDNYHLTFYKGSGLPLQPDAQFSHQPFIANNQVWYAPIGIWRFDKFPNASANLIITFDAILTKKFAKPEYGIELEFAETWLHQSEPDLGPYLLKDKFITLDKSIKLDVIGRKLPYKFKNIGSKEAAQLEMKALTQSNPDYQIASEQAMQVGEDDAYQFTAKLKTDDKPGEEYRLYIAKKGYLFWLIGSASEIQFEKYAKKFQAIAKSWKLNLPERFQ